MSDKERKTHLIDKHCSSLERPTSNGTELLVALEDLADTNRDGTLDCSEFNAASFSFDASNLCGGGTRH